MSTNTWEHAFRDIYARGSEAWKKGQRSPKTMFTSEDTVFLHSIGCSTQELFDFIEDWMDYGEPDLDTVLQVQAIRRAYFQDIMHGKPSGSVADMRSIPSKSDAIEGIPWLPRLIAKARLKLRGEMPPDLMYGCGGDRPFLRRMKMTLPAFLQLVWDSSSDDQKIVQAVKQAAGLS